MSLSAVELIVNIQAPNRDQIVNSFDSLSTQGSGGLFFRTDVNQFTLYPVVPYLDQSIRYWDSASGVDEAFLRAGIGDPDQRPTSGTTPLTYLGDGSGLTAIPPVTISAADFQTALNSNATISGTGATVTVAKLSDQTFQISWSANGSRDLVLGDGSGLVPESNVFSEWITEGDAGTKAVQLIQFVARPLVYVETWTPTPAVAVVVTTLRVGGESDKAQFQISISGKLNSGTFAVKGSAPIAFNSSAADMLTALGDDWGAAVKTGSGLYTIERAAVGVYTLADADVDITALTAFNGFIATLGFNKAALYQRFSTVTEDSFSTDFQIRQDDASFIETLLFVPVTLHKDILSPAATSPTDWNSFVYTKAQIDAFLAEKVAGPASATDSAIALFDGAGGKEVKDSAVTISTDATFAANSDLKVPTEKAVKTYVAGVTDSNLRAPSDLDCSANPNYPAGNAGDSYYVTVAGKIGGASGLVVNIGDLIGCKTDNAGGTQAAVGSSWFILESNRDQATDTIKGVVLLADDAKVDAGIDDSAALTVLKGQRLFDNNAERLEFAATLLISGIA